MEYNSSRMARLPTVAQDKDGRWFCAFQLPDGGVRMEYFETERAARKALKSLLRESGRGQRIVP